VKQAFGARASQIPVTSIKSMVGHCLAAAGAIEAAALALSLAHGVIPPTIHYREPDPECDLDIVANQAREQSMAYGLSISLAFGGNNAALVMRRFKGARS
jgi:3-oxoacyl-[acyl-carrier-protein] synthase II